MAMSLAGPGTMTKKKGCCTPEFELPASHTYKTSGTSLLDLNLCLEMAIQTSFHECHQCLHKNALE
jgi:hypothetical protein